MHHRVVSKSSQGPDGPGSGSGVSANRGGSASAEPTVATVATVGRASSTVGKGIPNSILRRFSASAVEFSRPANHLAAHGLN